MPLRIIPASSLEKIFLDQQPAGNYTGGSLLMNEGYSFQFAFTGLPSGSGDGPCWGTAEFRIESDISDFLDLYLVGNVGVTLPAYTAYDQGYLRTAPGMYPDPLFPLSGNTVKIHQSRWQSIWIRTHGELPAGDHPVRLTMASAKYGSASAEITLRVLPCRLPEQTLKYTCWFHCDCIADLHRCAAFSEAHWQLIDQYMELAGANGINMLLVPAFTPPLDTPVGSERMTVQLVGVKKQGEVYEFDFTLLDRYLNLARKHNISWFEHSHLFTQWGAEHAPKVIAEVNGRLTRIFGWETQADGPEYTAFLHQYLDALLPHLRSLGLDQHFYFHISDEPNEKQLAGYRRAKAVVEERLREYHLFDALSHVEFYEQGLVPTPVAVTSSINDFLGKCDDLWAYYTGGQSFGYSNRLISMASRRNRVLGLQLYKYSIKGFLQWAYNFYYTTLSREQANPFLSPDALGEFPAGTAYQVYPHENGPIPSLRLFVFQDGLQDMRALQLLESFIGHDKTVAFMEKIIGPVDWTHCPAADGSYLALREAINQAILNARDQV